MAARRRRAAGAGKVSPGRIEAWSYSRWSTYSDCPQRAKFAYVEPYKSKYKDLDKPGPAMARGSKIHSEAELYVTGEGPITKNISLFRQELDDARSAGGRAEEEWAFTSSWKPCGWFSKDPPAWCRIKVDLVWTDDNAATIVDHKTGQIRQQHEGQLSLYALGAFVQLGVEEVSAELWYLDHGEIRDLVWTRDDLPDLHSEWEDKTTPMLTDTRFRPNPGNHCRWCPFSKAKGGPCDVG